MDIRVLPNSHGGLIYLKDEKIKPIAITLPILNVRYSYTPIIFAFSYVNYNYKFIYNFNHNYNLILFKVKLCILIEGYFFRKNNLPKNINTNKDKNKNKLIYTPNRLNFNFSKTSSINFFPRTNIKENLFRNKLKNPFNYLEDCVFIAYTQST